MPKASTATTHPRIVFALVDAAAMTDDGQPVGVRAGQCWLASDPFVLNHVDLFGDYPPPPYPFTTVTPVEQTTAAPGEVRSTRRGMHA